MVKPASHHRLKTMTGVGSILDIPGISQQQMGCIPNIWDDHKLDLTMIPSQI